MRGTVFGQGENIVFLHGWGGDASAFLFAARALKGEYKSLLIDLDGFGSAPEPEKPMSVTDYAEGVRRLMTDVGFERAVLVGHSFGGRVAVEIAAKFPDRAAALVLVDSAGLKPRRGLRYYFKIYLHKLLKKLGFQGLKGSKDYQGLSDVMRGTLIKAVNYDQTPLLKKITCPTAVFWGEKDKVTPVYMARKFKKKIADCEVFMLSGGHFAYLEDENKFMAVFTAFLREIKRSGV